MTSDLFPLTLPLKERLLFLLAAVRTIEQHDDWVQDWRMSGQLLARDDRVEVACFGGMRKGDILRGEPPRKLW